MSIKFLPLGGVFWVLGGGGSADFIFMGARIFLIKSWRQLSMTLARSNQVMTKTVSKQIVAPPSWDSAFKGMNQLAMYRFWLVAQERSQKFKVMKFGIWGVKKVVDFWWQTLSPFSPGKYRKAFQPEFGAYRGLARVLKSPSNPQNCRKEERILEKGTFIFCAKLWYAPNPGPQKRSEKLKA